MLDHGDRNELLFSVFSVCRENGVITRRGGDLRRTRFTADRIAHNQNEESGIERLLRDGYTVISDRYYYSSLAYQGSVTDPAWVAHLNLDCPEIRKPDLCVFLDLSPEISMKRITENRSSGEREIYETLDQLTRIRKTFLDVFAMLTETEDEARRENVVFVDASGTIEEVAQSVLSAVLGEETTA